MKWQAEDYVLALGFLLTLGYGAYLFAPLIVG